MSLLDTSIILAPDILANRPAAATVPIGAIFCVTDSSPANQLQRNNGATWDDYAPSGGGGANAVTAAGTLTANAIMLGDGTKTAKTTTTGTGIVTALGVNVGSAGSPIVNGGALGTPSSGTATSLTGLPLTTGVTGVLPVANGGTGSASGAAILKSVTALTNAQLLAWPGTPITAIAAPGSGLRLIPLRGWLNVDTRTANYTSIDVNASMMISIAGREWFSYLVNGNSTGLTQVTDLFQSGTEASWRFQPYVLGGSAYGTAFTDDWGLAMGLDDAQAQVNLPLVVSFDNNASGNLAGGDAGQTGRIVVIYMVEPVL